MKYITHEKLRELWKEFYLNKEHVYIGSASLIPENDPTVLFTTAGMHPLVPYLLGEKHPAGKRLVNIQKCVRTGDIDLVGDESHCTFFEMLGNWSLGDYFKDEQIAWSYEFLTDKKYLGIPEDIIAVTVFEGDEDSPRDQESAQLWRSHGIKQENIFFLSKEHNWWGPAGQTGPCGPDTEMFVMTKKGGICQDCNPSCDCGCYLEIWNDVFMQYNKTADGKYQPLKQKNVDTGMGLERALCVLQGAKSVYQTDIFLPIVQKIEALSEKQYNQDQTITKAIRIVADHIRTSVHMIGDGVTCSNVDRGYILRRLLRRAIRFSGQLGIAAGSLWKIAQTVIDVYKSEYPTLATQQKNIIDEINLEQQRFERTIANGMKEFEKLVHFQKGDTISGKACFKLYDTYGFPIEMTQELAKERGFKIDKAGFEAAFVQHQKLSKAGAEQRFKGGLADNTPTITRLHTATHLLHSALKKVLSQETVEQRGSNITQERLRFDFSFSRAMTKEEVEYTEKLVNMAIKADYPITCTEMTPQEAKEQGAIGLFAQKYGEMVKVYSMGEFSKEICGGPHAKSTGELGRFKIKKESSSSAGVRRIRAVLEE